MIRLIPITLKRAQEVVREWHSHHDPMIGHMWSTGVIDDRDELLGVVVVGRPVAPGLQDGFTLEVTRLCCKGGNNHAASRLLGAATTAAESRGIRFLVSYTRIDEEGISYKAAGWVAHPDVVKGRDHVTGNRALRWLPGFYEPTTEKIDRIRWEWRPPQAIRAVCKMVFAIGEWWRAVERKRRRAA